MGEAVDRGSTGTDRRSGYGHRSQVRIHICRHYKYTYYVRTAYKGYVGAGKDSYYVEVGL